MIAPLLIILGIAAAIAVGLAIAQLAGAFADADKNFSNCPVGSSVLPCQQNPVAPMKPLTPISQDRANALFKEMQSHANDIPFDYPVDCCYARAHKMAQMMKDEGVDCGKVWNYAPGYPPYPEPGKGLVAYSDNVPVPDPGGIGDPDGSGRPRVGWGYHVAPVVAVEQPDGSVKMEVIDPSMFDHPVTVEEWKKAQNSEASRIQYSDPTVFWADGLPPGSKGSDGKPAGFGVYDPTMDKTGQAFTEHFIARDSQPQQLVERLAAKRAEATK
jgi:hypothetical protein